MTKKLLRAGAAMFSAGLAMACSQIPVLPSGGAPAGQPVTFKVQLAAEAFSDKQPITVRIWDAEQLAISDATAGCSVSYDATTGKETTSCPPGVTYKQATPETFTFTRAELAAGLTVASKTVTTGERYRVGIGGKASDDCNTAGANAEGTAAATTIELKNLDVAQTAMACLPPGSLPPGSGMAAKVTFNIALDATRFSDKRQITVKIYDADQLALEASGKATPEETMVSQADLARGLTLSSTTVTVGEKYRIDISGLAADDCNEASAGAEGTAASSTVSHAGLLVAQTKKACEPTR
jgi:hypothetical protein